jgi:cytochrome b involved in lipid metabolism
MCHPFQPSHPLFLSSTHQLLEDHRGEDITEAFQGGGADGHPHSRGARALLEGYCVGRLEGHEAQAEPSLDELVDETKPLLPQVGRWLTACSGAVQHAPCRPPRRIFPPHPPD